MKKKDWIVMILGICFIIFCFLFPLWLIVFCSGVRGTPTNYPNTDWISTEPDIYFTVSDMKENEGVLTMENENNIRIYVGGRTKKDMIFYDAEKMDLGEEVILLEGEGYWWLGKFVLRLHRDNVDVGTTKIIFEKKE